MAHRFRRQCETHVRDLKKVTGSTAERGKIISWPRDIHIEVHHRGEGTSTETFDDWAAVVDSVVHVSGKSQLQFSRVGECTLTQNVWMSSNAMKKAIQLMSGRSHDASMCSQVSESTHEVATYDASTSLTRSGQTGCLHHARAASVHRATCDQKKFSQHL